MTRSRAVRAPRRIAATLALAALALGAVLAASGEEPAPGTRPRPVASEPEALRAELAAEQAQLERELAELRSAGTTPLEGDQPRAERIRLLERLERIHAGLGAAIDHAERLDAESAALAIGADPEALAHEGVGSGPFFTLLELDAARSSLLQQTRERERAERTLQAAEQSLEAARAALAQAESARRIAREESEAASDGPEAALLRHALALDELEARIARALVRQRQIERTNAETSLVLAEQREERWREAASFVRARLEPSDDALASARRALDERVSELERRIERAKSELATSEARQKSVQRRLEAAGAPGPALREEAATRRLETSLRQRELALLGERLLRARDAAEEWGRRDRLLRDAVEPADSLEWIEQARASLAEGERQARIRSSGLEDLRADLAELRGRLAALPPGSAESRWLERQVDAQERLIRLGEEDLASLEDKRRLEEGLLEELLARDRPFDVASRLGTGWARVREVWSYEIATSEDNPITVGKIASAICVFLIGYLLARGFSSGLGRRIFLRLGLEEGAAHAFQSLTFYALLVLVFVASLRIVNIPLTALAFVGGALAIGVGFGSQNVVSNFISGVILLAERPIKLGDLVEVGGIYGTVERIGLRSTRVRTGDNIHVIVPNASFLESNVVNWTHTDANVRVSVQVGVVYGSPTREVERIIRKVLAENPRVQKSPEPIVLFTNFGDNSLDFQALFWIRMRRLIDRLSVESEVRFRIDDLFREAGIVIAFPQRDVHLDAAAPIAVRIVPDRPAPD